MRQYQQIWNQLKLHKKAKVLAPVVSHKKIIKAVSKEKWMDKGFKLLALEKDKVYKISYTCDAEKNLISFILEEVNGIRLSDL